MTAMEPGLALIDEIGRKALTNAFIQFSRENSYMNPYKPLYWDTPDLVMESSEQTHLNEEETENQNSFNINSNLQKCPSDPYIQKGFQPTTEAYKNEPGRKFSNVPSMMITPASVSNSTSLEQGGSAVQIDSNHPEQKLESSTSIRSRSITPSDNIEYEILNTYKVCDI